VPDEGAGSGLTPEDIVELLEQHLLGDSPTLTGPQVAERAGIPFELAKSRWRSLGFTTVPDDEVAFTEADVRALQLTERMHELGLVADDDEASLIRTVGRSFARLSEWQLALLARTVDIANADRDELAAMMPQITPVIEEVMSYVWRRHTLGAATRMVLAPTGGAEERRLAVGFADIVGYTRQSRSLRREELARLVEDFEAVALAVVGAHGGRIIKTIGDEVLFVADDPHAAAALGLELAARHAADTDFPGFRVGLAF